MRFLKKSRHSASKINSPVVLVALDDDETSFVCDGSDLACKPQKIPVNKSYMHEASSVGNCDVTYAFDRDNLAVQLGAVQVLDARRCLLGAVHRHEAVTLRHWTACVRHYFRACHLRITMNS